MNSKITQRSKDQGLVKQSLSAHSVIGLTVGALMYLICLTGTLAVFMKTFERWEQPEVAEFLHYDAVTVKTAWQAFIENAEEPPHSLYAILPTDDMPRMQVSGDGKSWYLQADGSIGDQPRHEWSEMLEELHINLHLPTTIGLVIVSACGAMLLALIVSGIFSHPRIFKDAFKLRLGGNRHLEQADIHNRLSVWGLPFHIMIALTGAFFGLVGPLVFVAATVFYDGDRGALFDDVYGGDPVVDAPLQNLNVQGAFDSLAEVAPEASAFYIVAQNFGQRDQFMEIAATLPGRLSYSEMYRFAADGSYLGNQGLTNGDAARQWVYSVYRIHFGWFGGQWVKVVYLLLGFAMTVISVSGINIWLARRGTKDWINDSWCGLVWGVPLSLSVSAFSSVILNVVPLPILLITLLCSQMYCLFAKDEKQAAIFLKKTTAFSLCILSLAYVIVYAEQRATPLTLGMVGAFITTALILWVQPNRQVTNNRDLEIPVEN